ncbi:hypothetical protein BV20DRAFT_147088 [Pilatotrama ljubarskyi]|nr:hypothetical protein BV20DRAFT_147088 [Pilatotrama ljubarskyi]
MAQPFSQEPSASPERKPFHLLPGEHYWRDHYDWLRDSGYALRPRYKPDWTPSWEGTQKSALLSEDSQTHTLSQVVDAVRLSDGEMVMLKKVRRSVHPYEVAIGQYFSSGQVASEPRNHCCPLYDVLQDPKDDDLQIIVMPLLRRYNNPSFETVGEAVEFFSQVFEGINFMHEHHVAHRDCQSLNIMMDPRAMFPEMYHPVATNKKRDFSGLAKSYTRTRRPTRYLLTDFGLSRKYSADETNPQEIPILGADRTVPEFQDDETTPRNPFPTDVYYLGNMIRQDFLKRYSNLEFMSPLVYAMVAQDPEARPPMFEVVTQFRDVQRKLTTWQLRSRLVVREDDRLVNLLKSVHHFASRTVPYLIRRLPPTPSPQP